MNQIPKRLSQEPLLEAIWQVQFDSTNVEVSIPENLQGILFSELRKKGKDIQAHRLPAADIPQQIAQTDPNLRYAAKIRIQEINSPFLFHIGDRVLTLNCPRPYVGWSKFKDKISELIDIVYDIDFMKQCKIERHTLRYIDLLTLAPAPDLSSLQLRLQIGREDIKNKPLQIRTELLDEDCIHILQIATPAKVSSPKEKEKEGSLVDMETFSITTPKTWDSLKDQIDHLHKKSKSIFFERLLTSEAIEAMKAEY